MEINGKILDSSNEPLYLANITIVNGSQNNKFGTVANENGEFSLSNDIISSDSEFKISYQGFKPQFCKASELQEKTIKLEENAISFKEAIARPQDKPVTTNSAKNQATLTNVQKHKLVYAGLGGLVGLLLLLTSIKKLK